MAKIVGRGQNIGVGVEAVRGAGFTPTFWIPKSDFTMDDKANKARTREGFSHIGMDGNQALVTRQWAEGDLEMDMYDKSFGVFLYALLGSKSVSGPTDSAYTHLFTLSNTNQHQSLALVAKEGSLQRMFKLSMINSMEITVTPDDVVKITVNFMSKAGVDTTQTSTYIAENKFVGRHFELKLASLTSGLAAASKIPVKEFTLTIEKNTSLDHSLGTVQPQDILNQGFRITGSFTIDYEDRTYRDLMMNGTYRAMRVRLTHNTLIGVSAVPRFTLDLSRVDFDQWEPSYPLDEIANQTINFTALYDITNGNIINSCELINAQASY